MGATGVILKSKVLTNQVKNCGLRAVRRTEAIFILILACPGFGLRAYAGGFTITLQARSGGHEQSEHNHSTSAAAEARSVLAANTKASLRVHWSIISSEKAEAVPYVTVHCFLDK